MPARVVVHEAHGSQSEIAVIAELAQCELAPIVRSVDQHARATPAESLANQLE